MQFFSSDQVDSNYFASLVVSDSLLSDPTRNISDWNKILEILIDLSY